MASLAEAVEAEAAIEADDSRKETKAAEVPEPPSTHVAACTLADVRAAASGTLECRVLSCWAMRSGGRRCRTVSCGDGRGAAGHSCAWPGCQVAEEW